jgi:hypothetical protein
MFWDIHIQGSKYVKKTDYRIGKSRQATAKNYLLA